MLDYVIKLTRDPGGMTAADTEALKRAGFGERAVLDICQVASYYNYVNRLADGLGVELEHSWRREDCTLAWDEFEVLRRSKRSAGRDAAATAPASAGPAKTAERGDGDP